MRFLDGFASNPQRRVRADGNKVQGLKTHDCHVLLERVLPVILRGLGRPDLYRAVAELGQFFKELYSRNIRIDALEHFRDKIPTILCDLEKIYPPAFFDVMVDVEHPMDITMSRVRLASDTCDIYLTYPKVNHLLYTC